MKIEDMISANRADCSGCEACANICPKNAITMTRDAEGFAYPKINPELCIKCGRCDATCPALNYVKNNPTDFPPTFVTNLPAEKILRHSSSGGIFTALSELILRKGGVVFGAAFDEKWRVHHTAAKSLAELEKLRGSKYVQSQIGDVYRQVRDLLPTTQVLFSGTPCQCAGLKHFLGGDHENLLTVEIICHGVPSPALWKSYIDNLNHAHDVTSVNFRSKRTGWTEYIDINFADRAHIASAGNKNIFSRLSLIGMSDRPSCSACKFKFPDGQSDLTLGDAWGVKDFAPEMYDNRGVSLVFIHTDKGRKIFERMNLRARQVNFIDAIQKNSRYISSIIADPRRTEFFADFAKISDKFAVMEKYFGQSDDDIRKDINKKNDTAFRTAYREIVASIRQKFTENIFIVSPLDDDEKEFLIDHFTQTAPNGTLYFLRLNDKGELICRENFSSLDLPIKSEVAALKDFAEKFNVTQVVASDPLNLNVPAVAEWLNVCELPVQVLENDSAQDDAEIQDEVAVARQKFTENIFVVSPFADDAKEFLINHFAQTAPNGTLYFLRLNDKGELICRENFSSLDLPIKSEVAALKDFAEKFNVTQVVASDPLNLNVPAVAEWLKFCNLPVQVLENEPAQEDAEIQDEITSARQKFTENIFVVSPFADDAKKFLINHFARTAPNGTLYFLRLNDKGELICRENFSSLDLPIKSEVAALKDFAEKFNVAQVIAGNPLNLDVPAVAEWLKVCGLPVQILKQS